MRAKLTINDFEEMLKQMKNYHKYQGMSDEIFISVNDETGEVEFEQSSYYPECVGKFFRYTRKNSSTENINDDSNNDSEIKIGDILKMIRNIYDYKINDLADKLDISPAYISEIENNQEQPSMELLERFATFYDMKLSSLLLLMKNPEEVKKYSKTDFFIRKMMLKLIELFSK